MPSSYAKQIGKVKCIFARSAVWCHSTIFEPHNESLKSHEQRVGVLLQVHLDIPLPESLSSTWYGAEQTGIAHLCSLWCPQTPQTVLVSYSTL